MTLKLNNGMDIPQMGAGTWTLRGDVAPDLVNASPLLMLHPSP